MNNKGVGVRFVAVVLDMVILFGIGYLIALAVGATSESGFNLEGGPAFVWVVVSALYYIILEGTIGATLGKKALGIRVVEEDGTRCHMRASIVRNVFRIVDGLFVYLVGAILIWRSPKKQRLGDRLAHTLVVGK